MTPEDPAPGKWRLDASCANLPVEIVDELFFPAGGTPGPDVRKLCAGCPVRVDCYLYATEVDAFGVWAGTGRLERSRLIVRDDELAA